MPDPSVVVDAAATPLNVIVEGVAVRGLTVPEILNVGVVLLVPAKFSPLAFAPFTVTFRLVGANA